MAPVNLEAAAAAAARRPSTAGTASDGLSRSKFCDRTLPKGQLQFTGDFEGGNLGTVKSISEFEYEISLRHDTNAPKYRLWFHFKVNNCKAGQRVVISIVNFSKQRSLFRDGMSPLVCSTSKPRWERIPPKNCFYYRSQRNSYAYVLSYLFVFDKENDIYAFAYSYPFTYTYQQHLLSQLEWQNLPYVKRELLCRSVQQRRVDVLTITDPAPLPHGKRKRMIAISSRIHPGETPASYVVTGIINFIVSDHPDAQLLRQEIIWVIVPMLNPDGCFQGNYRTCSLGLDLNRMWDTPSESTEPSLLHTRKLLQHYSEDPSVDLDFFIDVHSHSTARMAFLLCNPPGNRSNLAAYERASWLPRLLENSTRDFSLASCRFCIDPQKTGTGRRSIGDLLLHTDTLCYTLEVSFFPGAPDSTGAPAPTTDEGYMEFGRQFTDTFIDYYRLPRPSANPLSIPIPPRSYAAATSSSHSSTQINNHRDSRDASNGNGSNGHTSTAHMSTVMSNMQQTRASARQPQLSRQPLVVPTTGLPLSTSNSSGASSQSSSQSSTPPHHGLVRGLNGSSTSASPASTARTLSSLTLPVTTSPQASRKNSNPSIHTHISQSQSLIVNSGAGANGKSR